MSLLLAPYNNGMRIGQGFNSFTQQICVDNAVVVDPERAENVITNDGVTMRILAQKMKKASVWRQMKEYVNNGEAVPDAASTEPNPDEHPDSSGQGFASTTAYDMEYEDDEDEEAEDRMALLEREQAERDAKLLKTYEEKKAAGSGAAAPAIDPAAPGNSEATTTRTLASEDKTGELTEEQADAALKSEADLSAAKNKQLTDDREAQLRADEKKTMDGTADTKLELIKKNKERNERMAGRGTGIGTNKGRRLAWSMQKSIGTSQIVTYSSRFVDKLSEISDDMSGSAALSIKAGSFGGSGSGAFINTDKFYSSDIKFYLSVKVVNQSINFKDALEYNPIRSVSEANADQFNTVFGDSFISGFLEGGELNAVVMIKVLNDAKKKDIMAEAAVALTKGIELKGQGNIALAKQNIQMNTEVSINVRWTGGASIKNYNEPWTIDSLMAAANRFPYLVSQFPQRTYAVLTKYETLRSFVKLKPAKLSPLKYENATIYGNMLQDAFFEYTALAKRVASDIRAVQAGVKRFKEKVPVAEKGEGFFLSSSLEKSGLKKFAGDLEGLDAARVAIRQQMNAIVREIDVITKDPAQATKDRGVRFIGPASFLTLIPEVEYKVRKKIRGSPLSGERINDEVKDVDKAIQAKAESDEVRLFDQSQTPHLPLSEVEQIKVADLERENPELAEVTRVTPPVGALATGTPFCTVDLGLQEPIITEISVGQQGGYLRSLAVTYSNGLSANFGDDIEEYELLDEEAEKKEVSEDAKVRKTLGELSASELIVSASIQVDAAEDEQKLSVVGLSLVTNKGRMLEALSKVKGVKGHNKVHNFEKPLTDGYISGFWGRQRTPEDVEAEREALWAKAEAMHIVQGTVGNKEEDPATETVGQKEEKEKGEADTTGLEAITVPDSRITRLGFVWTQAVVKDAIFDDESPIECQTSSTLLVNNEGLVKFGRKYPEVPQLIWGARNIKLGYGQRCSWNGSKSFRNSAEPAQTDEDVTSPDSFFYSLPRDACTAPMQWMVLPELEHVHIQCGEVTILTEGLEQTETIAFELPFDDGKTPDIICWIVGFDTGPDAALPDSQVELDIQVGAVDDGKNATPASFELKVTSSAGTFDSVAAASAEKQPVRYSSVTVGWLAHDKTTAPTESLFRSGRIDNTIGLKGKEIIPISFGTDTPFGAKPGKVFFALSALRRNADQVDPLWSIGTNEITALGMKVAVSAPASSTYKGVWIASL